MKAEKNGIIFYGTPKEMAELFNLTEKEVRKQLKEPYHPQPMPFKIPKDEVPDHVKKYWQGMDTIWVSTDKTASSKAWF